MLILGLQGLVVLETPKTGSLALRAMLAPYTLPVSDEAPRHIGYHAYVEHHAAPLSESSGRSLETVAVVRSPLQRMQSWYRYRMRPKVDGLPVSTRGHSFEEFMLAYLEGTSPQMANVGRQDRFVGWSGDCAGVDHLFDYEQLDLLEAFFSDRIGAEMVLPVRNISPLSDQVDYSLSNGVLARYHAQNADEFALYQAVAAKGHLRNQTL